MTTRAVTIDAYGTLVTLRDPAPALQRALEARGVARSLEQVRAAFEAEAAYYVERSHEGRDEATLSVLRRECARVFLEAAGAEVEPDDFVATFLDSLVFVELPGAAAACRALADAGLRLAVVSNWDVDLRVHLADLGLTAIVEAVITSAEAGAPKPDPAIFELALATLGVPPEDVVHIGDAAADEEGARAAGVRFEPAPLADAAKRILAA
jgi:putative hydrolase of the HAD superfamily